jgi:PadR family transcriptional regulator PadR
MSDKPYFLRAKMLRTLHSENQRPCASLWADTHFFYHTKMLRTLSLGKLKNNYMVNVDNTKSQMRKGMLEYCILLLLRHRPLYANDIITQLKFAEMIVVEGTLYPLLNRLKKDGLLKYEWQESTQGPPRKYYALTEEGEEALLQLDASWNELTKTVNILHSNY